MFKKILIANRGEIACRIMRTAQAMGANCVAVYSDADRDALHVEMADEAYRLGPASAVESYLRSDKIIQAAKECSAEAIHPGYGFLSENPEFVEACAAADLVFIGPGADAIRAMGLKDAAKKLMQEANVPVVPGYHGANQEAAFLANAATDIGYPVLIKARAGGGGKGMRLVKESNEFIAALESARRESQSSFGDDAVLVEKYVSTPRHIEVQVFGDQHGNVVHLFERDCSLQRRHQKVIEEAPAPGMTETMRNAMGDAAIRAAKAVNYVSAGTVEFIVDASEGLREDRFYFMEMNTRLQVEHPVTEAITGLDLVEWQLRVASGEKLPRTQDELNINGHAFEARIYAEDAEKGFMPATGTLHHLYLPDESARIDTGVREGDEITPFYDPMIAKLTVHGPTRAAALNALASALMQSRVAGSVTNIGFLAQLAQQTDFVSEKVDTGLIDRQLDDLVSETAPSEEIIAVAALTALGYLNASQSDDPWFTLLGWRHWSEAKQYANLIWRGQRREIMVISGDHGSKTIDLGDSRISARLLRVLDNEVRIDFTGRIANYHVISEPGAVTVFNQGHTYRFALADHLVDDEEQGGDEDRLIAPLPGVVTAVKVKAGDTVAQDDSLIVMEAMKMEHTLTANRDGIVEEINVTQGDQVEEGAILMKLSELETEAD